MALAVRSFLGSYRRGTRMEILGENRPVRAPAGMPPLRFSLRALFVVTALVAILAAGASYGGPAGFVFTLLVMSAVSCLVTYFIGRLRLSNALGLLAVVIVIAVVLLPAFHSSPRINTRRDACENNLRQ